MKTPILIIHGGNTYPSKEAYVEDLRTKDVHLDRMRYAPNWKETLQPTLGDDFDVLLPRMPMADNAEYDIWKLWFERILEVVNKPCILIGHSLGAMFLIKYLSENAPKHEVPLLLLAAPEFTHVDMPSTEQSSFSLKGDIAELNKRAKKVVFFHSKDDPVVSFESFTRFKESCKDAEFQTFTDRGHFLGEFFPEITKILQDFHSR
jgi:uncharacterized protein